jgi:hypothetical protein
VTVTAVPDPVLDSDQMMLEGIDTSKKPTFSISEMARFFFGRTPHWIRWLESKEPLALDGIPIKEMRTASGARQYDLATIEKMAHAYAANGRISGAQLRRALVMIRVQAEMYEYL